MIANVPACIAQWNGPNPARVAVSRLHPKSATVRVVASSTFTWGSKTTHADSLGCVIVFRLQKGTVMAMATLPSFGRATWGWMEEPGPTLVGEHLVSRDGKLS